MVNDDLLIDMGPDLMSACFMYGKSDATIKYLLQTHPHSDHFDPQVFTTRVPEYVGIDIPELHVYASGQTLSKMSEMVKAEGYVSDFLEPKAQERMHLRVSAVRSFEPFEVGEYQVTAFPTNHDAAAESMSYVIRENGFTLFYCTDTDALPEGTWSGLRGSSLKLDVVVLDHTYGPGTDGGGHLNAERFGGQLERMKREAFLAAGARVFATHISHEGNPPHVELSKYAADHGYEIAYDGLVISSSGKEASRSSTT